MKQKIFLITILLIFLNQCGYTPIYSNNRTVDFKLEIIDISGDNEMNNLISSKIKKYSNPSAKKTFRLKVKTDYIKDIITKDKTGKATNYLIKKKVEYEIVNSENNIRYVFDDKINATGMDNQYDFKKYESTIKNNFISLKLDQLILKLSNIK